MIRIITDFARTMQIRDQWNNLFKVLNIKQRVNPEFSNQ